MLFNCQVKLKQQTSIIQQISCHPLQSNTFSLSEISKINLHPNSLNLAGILQATCKKRHSEDKMLANFAFETPPQNAFGIKESVQKTVVCWESQEYYMYVYLQGANSYHCRLRNVDAKKFHVIS